MPTVQRRASCRWILRIEINNSNYKHRIKTDKITAIQKKTSKICKGEDKKCMRKIS